MTNEIKAPPQVSWQDPKGMRSVAGGRDGGAGLLRLRGRGGDQERERPKLDLACLFADRPAAWAATLTTNRFAAAPVKLARALLRRGGPLQAVLVNSGNANAATGPEGERRARAGRGRRREGPGAPRGPGARLLDRDHRPAAAGRPDRARRPGGGAHARAGGRRPGRAGDHDHGHLRRRRRRWSCGSAAGRCGSAGCARAPG